MDFLGKIKLSFGVALENERISIIARRQQTDCLTNVIKYIYHFVYFGFCLVGSFTRGDPEHEPLTAAPGKNLEPALCRIYLDCKNPLKTTSSNEPALKHHFL